MDFFKHQERAQRSTTFLMRLFLLAIGGTIVGMYCVVMGFIAGVEWYDDPKQTWASFSWNFLWKWDPEWFLGITLGTLGIIVVGCAWKYTQLKSGGVWVAESLGGRYVSPSSRFGQSRMLLDIVEELSIASGIPTPLVYILEDEQGINAFAAGNSPEDAVVGVTRGALNLLNKKELQGVIAHEFSHILNGDMQINLELIGLLGGIQGVGNLGRWLLNAFSHESYPFYHLGSRIGAFQLFIFFVGFSVMAVGAFGVFFASLIKAAISRQREFLADASAVQFTRYPQGLTSALKKIGGLVEGSAIHHPMGHEVSHMFFSQSLYSGMDSFFSTHPSLAKRIKRLDPSFTGEFPEIDGADVKTGLIHALSGSPADGDEMEKEFTGSLSSLTTPSNEWQTTPQEIVNQVGELTPAHLDHVHHLLDHIPIALRHAAHEPMGAQALILVLLLWSKVDLTKDQKKRMAEFADSRITQEMLILEGSLTTLDPQARLPLIDMAIPTLKNLSHEQYERFKNSVLQILPETGQGAMFGWTVRHVLLRHLEPFFYGERAPRVRNVSLKDVQVHCEVLLSTLAHQGHENESDACSSFNQARDEVQLPDLQLRDPDRCTLTVLDIALANLAQVTPSEKRILLQGCAACVMADQQATIEELELLRAISDGLGCPMPPILVPAH